jgi:exportin-2 (importin alpha re-exporter)
MEINDQNLALLSNLFVQILSPNNIDRKNAETYIKNIQTQQGFLLLLLSLINRLVNSSVPQEVSVRQSAAVLFKNLVKKHWIPDDDDESVITISESEKDLIKSNLVELMCTALQDVQKQLAEAVSIIAKHDFPHKWKSLLDQLVQKLSQADLRVTKGVMLTANSIMKRYRYVFKSDELYNEIIVCLSSFQVPLLQTYQNNGLLITQFVSSKSELYELFETQRLITRIYFSLNWQDIPEFFEDHIREWMVEFAKYLDYKNVLLVNDDENEPSAIEKLQAAILENLNLYATKYEDIFEPFIPQFTQLAWKLLMEVTNEPRFDILATTAIKFLTSICAKQMNVNLFTEPVLRDIVEQIVVKNLTATENDEELFEDNPIDYIRKDMEGGDTDTRRRSAIELVRSLLKFFSPQVSQLCMIYISAMLEQYQATKLWKAKDAALHLVLAVSIKSSSAIGGAGELNPNVNILDIFNTHILPEVHDANVNQNPIVKADAIKLICIFRTHLQAPFIVELLPHIIRHLNSKYVVIQTYSAMCIERFFTLKDRDNVTGKSVLRMTKEHLLPFFQQLFAGLFTVLENPDLLDNDYVMKCVMRMLLIIGSDIGSVLELVLQHLTKTLEKVCKNPVNPHFNHYLFESLAILVKSSTSTSSNTSVQISAICSELEKLLFPPLQSVLSMDVEEFIPYVFQILAQLLSARPSDGLSEPYLLLFPLLLSPPLWERKGNVPALTDLIKVYITKGMSQIILGNHLNGLLGVFQKLLSSKVYFHCIYKLYVF